MSARARVAIQRQKLDRAIREWVAASRNLAALVADNGATPCDRQRARARCLEAADVVAGARQTLDEAIQSERNECRKARSR